MINAVVWAASNGIADAIAHDVDTATTVPSASKNAMKERTTDCIPDLFSQVWQKESCTGGLGCGAERLTSADVRAN